MAEKLKAGGSDIIMSLGNFNRRRMKVQLSNFNFFWIFSVKRLMALTALCFCFCLIAPLQVFPQNLTNLEVFYKLSDSSVVNVLKVVPKESNEIYLRLDLPEGYSVFRNKIVQDLRLQGKTVLFAKDSLLAPSLDFSIDRAKVSYSELFRHGFFGSYKAERTVTLNGNFVLASGGMVKKTDNFSFQAKDTVNYDEIRNIEDFSIPFTRGDIPSEPVFSTLWEPVVALGTAAVAVYLFFTIRSK